MFAILAAASLTYAQSFGVRAGLNLGKLHFYENYSSNENGYVEDRSSDASESTGNLIGFHIGTVVDIGINEFFYIQPGITLTKKGGERESERYSSGDGREQITESKITCALYYLDIPVLFSLKGKLNDNLALRVQAGPYVGFGLFGSLEYEYEDKYNGVRRSEKEEIKNVFSPSTKEKAEGFKGISRFNAGISIGGGIEFSGIYAGLSYNYGLTNLSKEEDEGEAYESTLGITVGYNF